MCSWTSVVLVWFCSLPASCSSSGDTRPAVTFHWSSVHASPRLYGDGRDEQGRAGMGLGCPIQGPSHPPVGPDRQLHLSPSSPLPRCSDLMSQNRPAPRPIILTTACRAPPPAACPARPAHLISPPAPVPRRPATSKNSQTHGASPPYQYSTACAVRWLAS
jgi:hypothetical protein